MSEYFSESSLMLVSIYHVYYLNLSSFYFWWKGTILKSNQASNYVLYCFVNLVESYCSKQTDWKMKKVLRFLLFFNVCLIWGKNNSNAYVTLFFIPLNQSFFIMNHWYLLIVTILLLFYHSLINEYLLYRTNKIISH